MVEGNRVFTEYQEELLKAALNRIVPRRGRFPWGRRLGTGVAPRFRGGGVASLNPGLPERAGPSRNNRPRKNEPGLWRPVAGTAGRDTPGATLEGSQRGPPPQLTAQAPGNNIQRSRQAGATDMNTRMEKAAQDVALTALRIVSHVAQPTCLTTINFAGSDN